MGKDFAEQELQRILRPLARADPEVGNTGRVNQFTWPDEMSRCGSDLSLAMLCEFNICPTSEPTTPCPFCFTCEEISRAS